MNNKLSEIIKIPLGILQVIIFPIQIITTLWWGAFVLPMAGILFLFPKQNIFILCYELGILILLPFVINIFSIFSFIKYLNSGFQVDFFNKKQVLLAGTSALMTLWMMIYICKQIAEIGTD